MNEPPAWLVEQFMCAKSPLQLIDRRWTEAERERQRERASERGAARAHTQSESRRHELAQPAHESATSVCFARFSHSLPASLPPSARRHSHLPPTIRMVRFGRAADKAIHMQILCLIASAKEDGGRDADDDVGAAAANGA